jgi:hypothetical protein
MNPVPAPALRLHIGTLALPGVSRARGQRIGAAFRGELARLLGADAALQQLRQAGGSGRLAAVDKLDAGTLQVDRRERPERAGRRLARQVARGLLGAQE